MPRRGGWRLRRNKRRCNFCNPLPVSLQTIALLALASGVIAFSEYLLQVPANRIGFTQFSIGQLKIMQEAITPFCGVLPRRAAQAGLVVSGAVIGRRAVFDF